jgi:hypothetical protein
MGHASELAAELNAMQTTREAANRATMDAYTIIVNHADELWELTATATMDEVNEFASISQAARDAYLSCVRLNPNTLIVSTKVLPLLKLNIAYSPKRRISYVILMEQFTACSLPKIGTQEEFRFTVDGKLQPYITDGTRFLLPQQVADELIGLVGAFFKRAHESPSILS